MSDRAHSFGTDPDRETPVSCALSPSFFHQVTQRRDPAVSAHIYPTPPSEGERAESGSTCGEATSKTDAESYAGGFYRLEDYLTEDDL